MLLRERMRVLDLFRNWDGASDAFASNGTISVEDFKAGLHVLGLEASRRDIRRRSGFKGPPALPEDTASSVSLGHRKAPAAATHPGAPPEHPGAPPEQLGSSPPS